MTETIKSASVLHAAQRSHADDGNGVQVKMYMFETQKPDLTESPYGMFYGIFSS